MSGAKYFWVISTGALPFLLMATAATAAVQLVADRACLFLDDRFVAEQTGLVREWHPGKPQSEPAISGHWPHMFGSVLYDDHARLYKMWYEDVYKNAGWIHYAESRDGKVWAKPSLGLVEIDGTKANNCVWKRAELPNVFIDPLATDPAARFKMFVWSQPMMLQDETVRGLVVLRSQDGIRWEPDRRGVLPEPTDDTAASQAIRDTNQVTWDPLGQRYYGAFRTYPSIPGLVGFSREVDFPKTKKTNLAAMGGHRRGIGIATSKHLYDGWSPVVTALKPDARDDEKASRLGRDPRKADYCELYIMPTFVHGNHYLGLLSLLFWIDGSDTVPGGGDLQLAFSHDGNDWQRQPDRQTVVSPSGTGLVPCYAPSSPPLELGDEMWIYYTEATAAHSGIVSGPVMSGTTTHQAFIRAAVWRKDGFVSMNAIGKARLRTSTLLFEGRELRLNVQLKPGGHARVALLDADGREIRGFGFGDCEDLQGDSVAMVVRWKGQDGLENFAGKPVQLAVELEQGSLWSFRFVK